MALNRLAAFLVRTQPFVAKWAAKSNVSTQLLEVPPNIGCSVIVPPAVYEAFCQKTIENYGGVNVFVGPPGTGKSTYGRVLVNQHMKSGGFAKMFCASAGCESSFFASFSAHGLSIPRVQLFRSLPFHTILLFDQIDQQDGDLSSDFLKLLYVCAVESCVLGNCLIVVTTSSASSAKKILQINGGEKVRQLATASELRWGTEQVNKFIDASTVLCRWRQDEQTHLRELAIQSGHVSFLRDVTVNFPRGLPGGAGLKRLETCALHHSKLWKNFADAGL